MGEIVNLKLERKRRERAAKEEDAAAKRAKFGQPKSERKLTGARKKKEDEKLDGHKRDE